MRATKIIHLCIVLFAGQQVGRHPVAKKEHTRGSDLWAEEHSQTGIYGSLLHLAQAQYGRDEPENKSIYISNYPLFGLTKRSKLIINNMP